MSCFDLTHAPVATVPPHSNWHESAVVGGWFPLRRQKCSLETWDLRVETGDERGFSSLILLFTTINIVMKLHDKSMVCYWRYDMCSSSWPHIVRAGVVVRPGLQIVVVVVVVVVLLLLLSSVRTRGANTRSRCTPCTTGFEDMACTNAARGTVHYSAAADFFLAYCITDSFLVVSRERGGWALLLTWVTGILCCCGGTDCCIPVYVF